MRARLLLLAAALAAFGGSLLGGFHLDDYAIFAAPGPRPFAWPHPLARAVQWLIFQIAGENAAAFHAVSLLLHLVAVLLAFECARRLLPESAATVAAALFAVHPLQAEVVDYISAQSVLTAGVLAFSALLAALARRRSAACLLLAAAIAESIARPASLLFALPAVRFLRLFFVPWGFTVAPGLHEPLWLSAAAIGAVLATFVWRRAWRPQSVETWALLGLMLLLPGFSPYLAVFAFAAAIGLGIAIVAPRPAKAIGLALAAVFLAASVGRTYVWMSDERLWREAVRHAPALAEPKIRLARYLRAADALDLLNRAREQAPHNPEIPAEIGRVLLGEQQYQGAVEELSRALAMNPHDAMAFNNRGVALDALGQIPAAQADFERALALDPHLAEARENLRRLTGK